MPFQTRRVVDRPTNVDMTAKPIAQIIGGQEDKLARQLSHYRRALQADDVITRVREAYQVIEDEETEHLFLDDYRYIRNLVSHPELHNRRMIPKAEERFGESFIDPSSPDDIAKLREDAEKFMQKAKEILSRKLYPCSDSIGLEQVWP